jgi:preprotein translocase subunit Sss1
LASDSCALGFGAVAKRGQKVTKCIRRSRHVCKVTRKPSSRQGSGR